MLAAETGPLVDGEGLIVDVMFAEPVWAGGADIGADCGMW